MRLSLQALVKDLPKQLERSCHIDLFGVEEPLELQAVHDSHHKRAELFHVDIAADFTLVLGFFQQSQVLLAENPITPDEEVMRRVAGGGVL